MSQSESLSSLISQFLTNITVDEKRAKQATVKIIGLIESKTLKLLELVKALGDYLTADDDLLRPKALFCLATTISGLNNSSLSSSDIQVLNTFFVSKFDDPKCFKEALIGLNSLVEKDNFSPIFAKQILEGLEINYDSKLYLASTRYFAFEVLNKIFDKFLKFISKNLNDLFIKVFIEVANAEKDPRNLLISFDLNSKVTRNLYINGFTDELFDILFCYFPISFRPPKDDPYKITSDQLKDSLRAAIAGTALFDKDSYPNLLEKLSSTSPTVKKDTLKTIFSCVESYGFESIKENWVELWSGLKFEILHGDQEDDEDGIFPLVLSIFKTISSTLSTNEDALLEFWNAISTELTPNIKTHTKIKQTCAIYGSIASGSTLAFNTVTQAALLLLFNDSKDLNIQKQRTLITNLGFFTTAYLTVFGTSINDDKTSNSSLDNSLFNFKDEILMFLGKSLMGSSKVEVSLRTLAVAELTKLTTLSDFLNDEELSLIVQYFTETALSDENEYVFNSSIGGLVQISKINTQVLLEVTFPTLLSLLPDSEDDQVEINGEIKSKEKIFDIIGSITPNKEISDFLMIRFVHKFIDIGALDGQTTYLYLIASNLKRSLESVQKEKQFVTDNYLMKTFGQLVDFIVTSENLTDNNVFDQITDVLKLIIVFSSKKYHQDLVNETLCVFQGQPLESYQFFTRCYDVNILIQPTKLSNLFVKVLAAVDKSTKLPDLEPFLERIIKFVQTSEFDDQYSKVGYLELISLLVNKWCPSSTSLAQSELSSSASIETYTWITKGAILKIDSLSEVYIDRLVDLLKDALTNSELATKAFEILVIDLSIFDKFKKIQNNNVRLLYKQKLFQILAPKLVNEFENASDLVIKSRFLISLSFILKHTRREIIIPYLSSFLPLLLQALSLQNSNVRYASVLTLLSSIEEIPELISKHLQTLVPSLLNLIKYNSKDDDLKFNNPDVRVISLNCLHALTVNLPLQKLVPYQKEILHRLIPVLDDKKRKVRKAAVDTRQAFYDLGITAME